MQNADLRKFSTLLTQQKKIIPNRILDSNGAPVPHTNEDHRLTAPRLSTAASISSSTLSGSDVVRDSMTHDQLRQNGASNGQVMTSSRAMGSVQELTETESHTGSSRPSSWQASAVPVSLLSRTKEAYVAGHINTNKSLQTQHALLWHQLDAKHTGRKRSWTKDNQDGEEGYG